MARKAASPAGEEPLPVQPPVDHPIICRPFDEPNCHWDYKVQPGQAYKQNGRRPARYWYKTKLSVSDAKAGQGALELEEGQDELAGVNRLRGDVKRWRASGYEGATNVTKQLLRHWSREDRFRRLFFCQLEAVETVIYLTEIRCLQQNGRRRQPGFKPEFKDEDFGRLTDIPNEADGKPLTRYGCKMATGTGKTVVMSMLIAWAFCNRGQYPTDERFPRAVLVCCPNLTVKERLQVLRPETHGNYYDQFDIVPATLRPNMSAGKVLVLNWHQFRAESEHAEGGKAYAVVNKGPESDDAFARRILGDLYERAPLMVLNDEAHHAYRPAPTGDTEKLTEDEKKAREEATVWVSGLDRLNCACGIKFCMDLSATPFYLHGSGHIEGSPFPWLVSDFGLIDAIESGLVKIPRLPVSDTTGMPEPKYFNLYRNLVDAMKGQDLLSGSRRKPKPEALWTAAYDALLTLAGQWKERYQQIVEASAGQEKKPPVMILVCDNTNIAQYFYEQISGERLVKTLADNDPGSADDADDETEIEEAPQKRGTKSKTTVVFGDGALFPEHFSNTKGLRLTLRVDSKVLDQAESDGEGGRRKDEEWMRQTVATVGKPGEPGEHIRCVVSVSMLTEGWDANNVTQIFGLRAFSSQLLCEQVVGRGLRRMDYAVNKEGFMEPEYVDVFGIPFSMIPFKGRPSDGAKPDDRPKNHVYAMEGRDAFEMLWPNVEGYTFSFRETKIAVNVDAIEKLQIEPGKNPTDTFVMPVSSSDEGSVHQGGVGKPLLMDRREYYRTVHLQQLEFVLASGIVENLISSTKCNDLRPGQPGARRQLFPQVLQIVHKYVGCRIDFHGANPCELGLPVYMDRVQARLDEAIKGQTLSAAADVSSEEPALVPILNRYKPFGTTKDVNFKTTRPCRETRKSHLNQVVLDTQTWEASAAFYLEKMPQVICYARNDADGLTIPYEYDGMSHLYIPDFLVRLPDNVCVILEVKGYEPDQTRAKHEAAKKWVRAVNGYDKGTHWRFHVCRDPHQLEHELDTLGRE